MTADAIVIGGGIVGAACAEALSRDGLSTIVVEPHVVGGGATAAGMGHIVVMDDSEAQFALTNYSRDLWRRLVPELPRDVEYEPAGTVWVAADEAEMQAVYAKAKFYRERGVRTEVLEADELARLEPNLRLGLRGGLLVPDDFVVYSPCFTKWLLDRAQRATLAPGKAIAIEDRGVRLASGERLDAPVVICAAGTWTTAFYPDCGIRSRKGHLAITDRYPGFVRHQLIELGYLKSAHAHTSESVAFNAQPRATGQILLGSSRQFDVEDLSVEPHMMRRMIERAVEYMPSIAHLSVLRTWTGFRAATDDHLPLIGPVSGAIGRFIAAGHEGLGITTSLATGQLIADAIAGRASAIDAAPYRPGRMAAHG